MASPRLTWQLRWYRAALALSSAEFRLRFRDEAVGSLEMALASERERRGKGAAFWLWLRAMGDAALSTFRDRRASGGWTGGTASDVTLAFRGMRRSPQYAIVMIGTLALAIGGVAAVFMLADPILFRALPYRDAERLVRVSVTGGKAIGGYMQVPDFVRIENAGIFEGITSFDGPLSGRAVDLASSDSLLGYRVTPHFFDVLGAVPQRGRVFTPEEYAAARGRTARLTEWQSSPVLITDRLWSQLGRRDDIVGQPLRLSDANATVAPEIVGVLGPDFVLPDVYNRAPSFLVPGDVDLAHQAEPMALVDIFARLRPGTARDVALSQTQAVVDSVSADYPVFKPGRTVKFMDLRTLLFSRVRVPLLMLLGVTGVVLLLAIGNLTHLSLARVEHRAREVTLRRSLGGSTWRVVRLLLAESVLLALLGGIGALLVGKALFAGVMSAMPHLAHAYRLVPSGMSLRVVGLVGALFVFAVVSVGLLPAGSVRRKNLSEVLQASATRTRGRRRSGDRVLTGMQAALGASILVSTALVIGSFARLTSSVSGIDQDGVVMANVAWPSEYASRSADRLAGARMLRDAGQLVGGQPIGVQSGMIGLSRPTALWSAGADPNEKAIATAYPSDRVTCELLRLTLVAGRFMTDEEVETNAPVVVIDQRAASLLTLSGNAIGMLAADEQIAKTRSERRVIGIVQTVDLNFGRPPTTGFAFVPPDPRGFSTPALFWRGTVDQKIVDAMRAKLKDIEPRAILTAAEFQPYESRFGEPRLLASITGSLAALALILTVVGSYSVTSHAVAGRTSEIGIRMALGATASGVRRMVVREAVMPAVVGVILGLVAAGLWVKTIATLLFQITARDPLSYTLSGLLIVAVVALAAIIPASRASRINPTEALRAD